MTATPQPLVAKETVTIDAPVSTVWEVLTRLRWIAEWDDLPDEWEGDRLVLGSELLWHRVDGGYTRLTVAQLEPPVRLRLALYGSTWPRPPAAYDVGYTYTLERDGRLTRLAVEIGDFAELAHGEDFLEASVDFAGRATRRIKALAEDQLRTAGALTPGSR